MDWDKAVEQTRAAESDTSLYVYETLGEVLAELECEELITPARRELYAEGRVAAPATQVARRLNADEVPRACLSINQPIISQMHE